MSDVHRAHLDELERMHTVVRRQWFWELAVLAAARGVSFIILQTSPDMFCACIDEHDGRSRPEDLSVLAALDQDQTPLSRFWLERTAEWLEGETT